MNKKMLHFIRKFNINLTHLIFPTICTICENELNDYRKSICVFCEENLERTFFERYKESTPLDELFWGRIHVEATYSYFYFEKGKAVQKMIHALKYDHKANIGSYFGEKIGQTINSIVKLSTIDVLVPVPLHHKKKFIRGYNQSEVIAKGIADKINVNIDTTILKRNKNTKTQTKKNKLSRWESIQSLFEVTDVKNYKHIAIVDDVITTGSTLETIISLINKKYPEIRVSIISLAVTK